LPDNEAKPKKRVLVVDDEPGIGNILRIKLRLAGYDVTITTSGAEAIEIIRTHEPDIVLLDIIMPEVSGLDVLERVRPFSSVPIIAFTARLEIAETAVKNGADDFLAKPFDPDQMVQKIGALLDRANPK
jgi:DNA-binding response OmpR family regulator